MDKSMKCVIIGSFRKYYYDILQVIEEFHDENITVLSPQVSQIIDPTQEFVILEVDTASTFSPCIHEIESKVLEHIRDSDFVYVYDPEGYIGLSTAFEIGFSRSLGKNIIAAYPVTDSTIAKFVNIIIPPSELRNPVSRVNCHIRCKQSSLSGPKDISEGNHGYELLLDAAANNRTT